MREQVPVADVEDFQPGSREIVEHDGVSVGVFNIEGEYYALLNRCIHDGGPVCRGRLKNKLVGSYEEPGKRVTEQFEGPPAVTCPWHGWEYEVKTGDHVGDADLSLPTYEVTVEDGTVYVRM